MCSSERAKGFHMQDQHALKDQQLDQVWNDRYQIKRLLARKTGRRTYLALDLHNNVEVVVKLLIFGVDFVWDDLKLFEREATVLQTLYHHAIPKYVNFFDVETELGKGFALVQTYIPAKSLQDWLRSGRTFSEADLEELAKQILGILEYLHGRQPAVIHRDIKPSNILLGDRSGNSLGQVYLVDFGSVQVGYSDGTRTIVGTYGYMPPEQFGGNIIPASDLYGLGATLIYLATGQSPDQLLQDDMQIKFEQQVTLKNSLVKWLRMMTVPSLNLRFTSAKQALAALESDELLTHQLLLDKPKSIQRVYDSRTIKSLCRLKVKVGDFLWNCSYNTLKTLDNLLCAIQPIVMSIIERGLAIGIMVGFIILLYYSWTDTTFVFKFFLFLIAVYMLLALLVILAAILCVIFSCIANLFRHVAGSFTYHLKRNVTQKNDLDQDYFC
jgi:serine/threonine protein kinase